MELLSIKITFVMAVQKQDKIRPCYDYGSFFVLRHCAYGVILRTDLPKDIPGESDCDTGEFKCPPPSSF